MPLAEARPVFEQQATDFLAACRALSELDLLDPALCRGWSRLDVVVHVRLGLDEMAAMAGARTARKPTHDAASYWGSYPDGRDEDPVPHILWLRRTAAAYGRPEAAVRHLADAVERVRAVVEQLPDEAVRAQGMVLTAGDFVATWVVELAIHQLDLAAGGSPVGAALARRTLAAIAGAELLPGRADAEAVLAGLGRSPWPDDVTDPEPFPIAL